MRGGSAGAGSLSVWTHNLKNFEYLPSVSIGDYQGKAARVAAGVQSFEVGNYARIANVTIVAPAGTVGVAGGWFQGGGHSTYTSYYGLGADQMLSLEVVTADGRFVTADPNNNTDLFWALRGGGGSEFSKFTTMLDMLTSSRHIRSRHLSNNQSLRPSSHGLLKRHLHNSQSLSLRTHGLQRFVLDWDPHVPQMGASDM